MVYLQRCLGCYIVGATCICCRLGHTTTHPVTSLHAKPQTKQSNKTDRKMDANFTTVIIVLSRAYLYFFSFSRAVMVGNSLFPHSSRFPPFLIRFRVTQYKAQIFPAAFRRALDPIDLPRGPRTLESSTVNGLKSFFFFFSSSGVL